MMSVVSSARYAARLTVANSKNVLVFPTARYMSVISLSTADDVDKFPKTNSKSILYFTASWCMPCSKIKPMYESLANKTSGIAFGKVDVDENADAAEKFQIQSVPTFVSMKGGEVVSRFSGADIMRLEALVKNLDSE